MEAGVLLDKKGEVLYWHLPNNRSGGALPDSVDLWSVFWENRNNISGFAHSHPGFGRTGPSHTDITTFNAVESGLGIKLDWWITSGDSMVLVRYNGPGRLDYHRMDVTMEPDWVIQLRALSGYETLNNADIEFASFNGGVTLDPNGPNAGTKYPNGTPHHPVNNLEDVQKIANIRGFDRIFLK